MEINKRAESKTTSSPSKSVVAREKTIEIDAKRMLESIQASSTVIPHGLTSEEMIDFIENN